MAWGLEANLAEGGIYIQSISGIRKAKLGIRIAHKTCLAPQSCSNL